MGLNWGTDLMKKKFESGKFGIFFIPLKEEWNFSE